MAAHCVLLLSHLPTPLEPPAWMSRAQMSASSWAVVPSQSRQTLPTFHNAFQAVLVMGCSLFQRLIIAVGMARAVERGKQHCLLDKF